MPATTPNVGVRTFLDRTDKVPFLIADMSTIGGVFTPGTGIDRSKFPVDTPVHFTTSDTEMVTAAGTGTLKQVIEACNYSGIVASIVACVPDILVADTVDQKMTKMVGDSVAMSGAWAMKAAQAETGVVPDLLIAPDFAHLRPGNAANPIVSAFDAMCEMLITPIAIADTPSANKTVAVEWAADWADTINVICCGQGARVSEAGLPVTRASAPYIAALMAKTDKQMGGPYYNPGNRPLGILGPSRAVECNYTDPDSEHNWLLQRGVNTIVQLEKNRTARSVNSPQGKMFWGFFNTSNDQLWRLINVVRTRKAIREVIPRTLVRYLGQNIGTNLVVVLRQSVMDFLGELATLPEPAILPGFDVIWDRDQNSNAVMRVGGLIFNAYWEESPALVDLQLYTGRREQSFDILASDIQAAMAQYNVSGTL